MNKEFSGWGAVSERLRVFSADTDLALNAGQRASLIEIAARIGDNGVIIADEVGMGKTRIAVATARAVVECGGRCAIIVPPGLGYQWCDELRNGGLDVRSIVRSLWAYLAAWGQEDREKNYPWFAEDAVVLSHAFTNWRLGVGSEPWRWQLLPQVYALWRRHRWNRFPRGYSQLEWDPWVSVAGESICAHVHNLAANQAGHPLEAELDELVSKFDWGGAAFDGTNFERGAAYRVLLEKAVGLGLGSFNLVIVDEAHKSRGADSILSRLLEDVVIEHAGARRFCMSATPVELGIDQWEQTLRRVGVSEHVMNEKIRPAIDGYAKSVKRVRDCWRTHAESRSAFAAASENFQSALGQYLLRRDKREEEVIQKFQRWSGLPLNEYRRLREVSVDPATLNHQWKSAICASEALSVTVSGSENADLKRLRLAFGSGHSISHVVARMAAGDEDVDGDVEDEAAAVVAPITVGCGGAPKRAERAEWWLKVIDSALAVGDEALFEHPAIKAAAEAIEAATSAGEKVLVFGRFVRPLRALAQLLNAREMLRALTEGRHWPQSRVRGAGLADESSEWPAVRAAHRQLSAELGLSPLDEKQLDRQMETQYEAEQRARAAERDSVARWIAGFENDDFFNGRPKEYFSRFRAEFFGKKAEVSLHVWRALNILVGDRPADERPEAYARAFVDMINAATDRDENDSDGKGNTNENEAKAILQTLASRLSLEYGNPQGTFARLMYGGTEQPTRRLLQAAFNRHGSNPRVLVAQSLVGREGLNLHRACRIVMLLHPEWNPGIVEQQIGRVDRVGNHWAKCFERAVELDLPSSEAPRIEIWPVVFRGTYDDYNWRVLRERWEELRAQLHGEIIPSSSFVADRECAAFALALNEAAPSFSPLRGQISRRPN